MPLRPLVPRFLKRLDDSLLINNPAVWSTRAHLAVWYSLLFAAALSLICFVVPYDARLDSKVYSWVMFVIVIIILSFVAWLIYLLRFNVFKKFGHLPPAYGLMTFFLYFIVIGFFIAWAYIPGAVESIRANSAYTNEEIIQDVNTINLNLCRLERDSLQLTWKADTSVLRKYMPVEDTMEEDESAIAPAEVDSEAVAVAPDAHNYDGITYYTYRDSAELFAKVRTADSLIRPNDSTYIFYACPSYTFINDFIPDDFSKVKSLSSVEIYNKVLKNYRAPDRKALIKEIDSLAAKYNTDSFLLAYHYPKRYRFVRSGYISHTQDKYNTYVFGRSMVNISEQKYRWHKGVLEEYVRPFYYIVLVLTLLVFIFRHTTRKTFFLSILTAVILTILTSLAFAFLRLRHSGQSLYWIMLSYFLLFAIVAFTISTDGVRRAWKGIALNLFVFFLPYIPLISVAMYYDYLRETYHSYEHPEMFEHKELHLLLSEIGGFVLLVVLLELVIRPLYRKWYSLPEQ